MKSFFRFIFFGFLKIWWGVKDGIRFTLVFIIHIIFYFLCYFGVFKIWWVGAWDRKVLFLFNVSVSIFIAFYSFYLTINL